MVTVDGASGNQRECCRRPRRWRPPRAAQPGTRPRRRTPGRVCPRLGPLRSAALRPATRRSSTTTGPVPVGEHGRIRMPSLVISTSNSSPSLRRAWRLRVLGNRHPAIGPQRHHTTILPIQSRPGPRTLPKSVAGPASAKGTPETHGPPPSVTTRSRESRPRDRSRQPSASMLSGSCRQGSTRASAAAVGGPSADCRGCGLSTARALAPAQAAGCGCNPAASV